MGNLKAKGQDKKGGSFNKLNAATRRAIYSLCILVGLFVLFSILQPAKFLAPANLQNLLQQIVTYTIIGCGLTFCLVCGGNDLSAGASMALSGIIMVSLLMQGLPLVVCIALCLVMGIMTGIMNGFFIEILGVVPFVATLATQWVYRGMANVLVIGALMMGVIRNGLNLNGVNSFWQQMIVGIILLIAVASQTAKKSGDLGAIKRFFGLKK
ncbi:MAG: hypothetical protein LBQ71_04990 [Hungatella sp.]|jgi:ribose transport system permease protein|nr:hypothetical protein [Hungatella sp.]